MNLLGSKTRLWLGAALVVAVPVSYGCGGKVVEEDDGDGGAATSSGGPSTTNAATTTGKGSSATGSVCDLTNDEPARASVTFRVTNKDVEPIFLPVNCGSLTYTVSDPLDPGVSFPGYRSCLQTCEGLRSSGHLDCGACAPESYRLLPGASVDVAWDGRGLLDTTMPLACFKQPGEGDRCEQLIAAQVGNAVEVRFQGYRSCGEGACPCTEDGFCSGVADGQLTFPNPVPFSLSNASVIEVVFGICSFGCAGG